MSTEEVPAISDTSSRSDWFRQTVLFWSSQNTNCECSENILGENGSPGTACLSPTTSVSSLRSDSSYCDKDDDDGDCIIDITTSELLRQVEEFEHCFKELAKKDDETIISIKNENTIASLIGEDAYSNTTETQSPHLTLEFPAGSSIRDSPLYSIPDAIDKLENNMFCCTDCPVDDEKSVIKLNESNKENNDIIRCTTLSSKSLITFNHIDSQAYNTQQTLTNNTRTQMENNTEEKCDNNDQDINIEKNEQDDRGDPNDVMRDILSCIKPPDGVTVNSTTNSNLDLNYTSLNGQEIAPELPKKENSLLKNNLRLSDNIIQEQKIKITEPNSDILLKQIDTLIKLENKATRRQKETKQIPPTGTKSVHDKLERLDSGLNGMSSDSNSPYPSPMVERALPSSEYIRRKSPGYDSGYIENPIRATTETIYESSKEGNEWDFPEDSDLSSDWSPLSTIDSADFSTIASSTGKRSRSYTVPHTTNLMSPFYNSRRTSTGNICNKKRLNSYNSSYDSSPPDVVYSESELSAIRKFLTLTRKYFDKGDKCTTKETRSCLDDLALIPNIKEVIDAQRKEVKDQRDMLEGFIRQLGDLLLEIVNLKDEQAAVRTKQAKALTLLKKQLDCHKKNQSQAQSDILEQVSILNEKLNSSISAENLSSSSPNSSSATSPSCSTKSQSLHSRSSSIPTSLHHHKQGQIIWKISDVMRKITRIKSGMIDGTLVSTPFQTGDYQYNMNAWMYLNGRGKMVGKFVSVYACVLVGEYDAILSWPVTPTYKFTLIDQRSDPTKRQDHVRYRRVLDIAGRGENVISQNGGIPRPTDGSKALIVGLDDFIAHDQLLKNRYLVDDVIFIKVEAEIN